MKELANFSIEGDGDVLLLYKDGTQVRTHKDDLSSHLSGGDLKRVLASFHHRKWFVRTILPPWARSVLIAVTVLAVSTAGIKAMHSFIRPTHTVAAASPRVTATPIRSLSPSSAPSPQVGVLGTSTTPTPTLPPPAAPAPLPVGIKLHPQTHTPRPILPDLVHHIVAPVTGTLRRLGL